MSVSQDCQILVKYVYPQIVADAEERTSTAIAAKGDF